MIKRKFLTVILSLLTFCGIPQGKAIDSVFTQAPDLLAISHYNNIAQTDENTQKILNEINPQTPVTRPVLSLLSDNILIEDLKDLDPDNWVEILYFSQPLEKSNNWVYVFHIKNHERYISSLLSTGNIRQEQTEDGITRYRRTEGIDFDVYYLTTASDNLIIMSENLNAVKKAKSLYQKVLSDKKGLLDNKIAEYSLLIHLNRYFLVNSRELPRFFNMLQRDILQDLAGATAKSDNILNLFLESLKESLQGLINEMAILELEADTAGEDVKLQANIEIQYGGSLHYALSAFEESEKNIINMLPEQSVILSELVFWNEEYIQMLEGIANLTNKLTNEITDNKAIARAEHILQLFQKVRPQRLQQGIIRPPANSNIYGPVAVSVITFEDASQVNELFSEISKIATIGDLAEFIAEQGIRLTTKVNKIETNTVNAPINEIEVSLRSTYFKLPETLAKKQYILSTTVGNHLLTAIPLAPLTQDQYLDARTFIMKTLKDTLTAVTDPHNNFNQALQMTARKYQKNNTIYSLCLNPLEYVQTIMQAEAVWPQPSAPNRLPIPWKEFSQFFNNKQADKSSAINLTINSEQTNIILTLHAPKKNIVELFKVLFNFNPVNGF